MKVYFISIDETTEGQSRSAMKETLITVELESGWWLWKRRVQRTYQGSNSVWRDIRTGYRAGLELEPLLSAIEWREKPRYKL